MPQEMPEGERRVLNALLIAADPLRDLSATFTLQMYYAFVMVAADEGKSIGEYAQRAGVASGAVRACLRD